MLTPDDSKIQIGTGVKSAITPPAGTDFGIFPQEYLIGGWRSVKTEADLAQINKSKYRMGMRVQVTDTDEEWELREGGFFKRPKVDYSALITTLRQRAFMLVAEHTGNNIWFVPRLLDKELPYTVYWGNAAVFESANQCAVSLNAENGYTQVSLNLPYEQGLSVRLQGFTQ